MQYFCASCKKKHPVGQIAADLRDIARQAVNERIDEIMETVRRESAAGQEDIDGLSYDQVSAFGTDLKRFVNTEDRSGKLFLFRPGELRERMGRTAQNVSDRIVEGTVQLDLAWLIDGYQAGGEDRESAFAADVRESGRDLSTESRDMARLKLRFGRESLFRQKLRVYFESVDRELVLDHIEDANGAPFYDDKRKLMLGYLRACPDCGRYVSRAVGHGEEIVVALMGSPRAGKTSCLTAVASALSSGRYARFGLSMTPFEHDQAWKDLTGEMSWYDRGYRVEKTTVDQRFVPAYSMLVQYFDKRRVLTFVDMPGEFWQSGQGMSAEFFDQYAGFFPNLDCIWFFISKLAAYGIDLGEDGRGQEEWQQELKDQSADDAKIIRESSAAKLMANLGQLNTLMQAKNGCQIPPIAVILTKMELELGGDDRKHREKYKLFPLDGGIAGADQKEIGTVLKHRDGSGGKGRRVLDERQWFERANKVRSFLRLVDPGLLAAVEQNCPFRSYISMAAYGHAAAPRPDQSAEGEETPLELEHSYQIDVDGRLREVILTPMEPEDEPAPVEEPTPPTPYRELFPLVWTLSIMGAVEIEHRCEWKWEDLLRRVRREEEFLLVPPVRYSWAERKPVKGEKQHETDLRLATIDIQKNLLMQSDPNSKNAFDSDAKLITTTFRHRR